MNVLQIVIEKIDDLLPALEAFAKATPSKTDDYAIGILRGALNLVKHRIGKQN
jgi:hypothetical protein